MPTVKKHTKKQIIGQLCGAEVELSRKKSNAGRCKDSARHGRWGRPRTRGLGKPAGEPAISSGTFAAVPSDGLSTILRPSSIRNAVITAYLLPRKNGFV
jgi:hypothetical protein